MEKMVIAPNGATFVCDNAERLARYLDAGWVIKPEEKPEEKPERRRKAKEE